MVVSLSSTPILLLLTALTVVTRQGVASSVVSDVSAVYSVDYDRGTAKILLSWQLSDSPDGHLFLCISPAPLYGRDDCNSVEPLATDFEVEVLSIPGQLISVVWLDVSDDLEVDDVMMAEKSVYIPWHLHFSRLTAQELLVTWDARETVFITMVQSPSGSSSVSPSSTSSTSPSSTSSTSPSSTSSGTTESTRSFPKAIPAPVLTDSPNWLVLQMDAGSQSLSLLMSYNLDDVQFTEVQITLIPAVDPVHSLPWSCQDPIFNSTCFEDEVCLPATPDFLSNINPEETDIYYHTCSSNELGISSHQEAPVISASGSSSIVLLSHGTVYWDSHEKYHYNEDDVIPTSSSTCFLRAAPAIMHYACSGRLDSCVVSPAVTTFAWHSQNEMECIPDYKVSPTYEFETKDFNDVALQCIEGAELFEETQTCYLRIDEELSFTDSRARCQALGGDLPFYRNELQTIWMEEYMEAQLSDQVQWWSLGTSDHDRDFYPYIAQQGLVSPSVMSGDWCHPYYDCADCPTTLSPVCALPPSPLNTAPTIVMEPQIDCVNDTIQPYCAEGGVCENYQVSIAESNSDHDDWLPSCNCGGDESQLFGVKCQSTGVAGQDFHLYTWDLDFPEQEEYVIEPAPEGLVLAVEYSRLEGESGHCRTASVHSLIRLRCNGRSTCAVPVDTLRRSLRSSCPRIISSLSLVIRVSYRSPAPCEDGSMKLNDRQGCISFTSVNYPHPQMAKEKCNSLGMDLAYGLSQSDYCQLVGGSRLIAWVYKSESPDHWFDPIVDESEVEPIYCIENGDPVLTGSYVGACERAMSTTEDSLTPVLPAVSDVAVLYQLPLQHNQEAAAVQLEWEAPSSNVTNYTACIEMMDGPARCQPSSEDTQALFEGGVLTGAELIINITAHYPSGSGSSSFVAFIPNSLSLIAATPSTALLQWELTDGGPLLEEVRDQASSQPVPPGSRLLELSVSQFDVSLVLTFSSDSADYQDLRVLATVDLDHHYEDEYHAPLWQCPATDCSPALCSSSLLALQPNMNPPVLGGYYEACHQDEAANMVDPVVGDDGGQMYELTAPGPEGGLNIMYADFRSVDTGCSLHSTLALFMYWCHGLDTCTVKKSVLESFFMNQEDWERDCTPADGENFQLHIEYDSLEEWYCWSDDWVLQTNQSNTCYGLSPSLEFEEARAWCNQKGGDLAYTTDMVDYTWLQESMLRDGPYWIKGTSEMERPVSSASTVLQRSLLTETGAVLCTDFSTDCEKQLPGLCSFPPTSENLVAFSELLPSDRCSQDICVNGGVCWQLVGERSMCDCPTGYYGDSCEDEADGPSSSSEMYQVEYDHLTTVNLTAPPTDLLYIEFALLGRQPYNQDDLQRVEGVDGSQGCYSRYFLQVLQARCNGRQSCVVSQRDLRHHIPSLCPRMITPRIRIRYSFHRQVGLCERGQYFPSNSENALPTGCYGAISTVDGGRASQQGCLDAGGDLLFSQEAPPSGLCSDIASGGRIFYAGDFNFWLGDKYSSEFSSNKTLTCPGSGSSDSSLCVFPLKRGQETCARAMPLPELYPDYYFNESQPGLARASCPQPFKGNATWKCSIAGQWVGAPNMTLCRALDLSPDLDELAETNRNRTAAEIVTSVGEETGEVELAPGDVVQLTELLTIAQDEHLEDLVEEEDSLVRLQIAELMVNSTADLSDKLVSVPGTWEGLPPKELGNALTKLQKSMDDAARTYSNYVEALTRDINETALSLRISTQPLDYYSMEEHRTFSSQGGTSITLPDDFHEGHVVNGSVSVVFTTYDTMHCIFNHMPCNDSSPALPPDWMDTAGLNTTRRLVNSYLIGADVGVSGGWQQEEGGQPVAVRFQHLYTSQNDSLNITVTCSYWDTVNETWGTEGCQLVGGDRDHTLCSCSHLTNLAVIMDINGVLAENEAVTAITKWVTLIGCSMSLACLAVTSVVLLGLPAVRQRGSNVVRANICVSLFLAELILLVGLDRTGDKLGCAFVAAMLHYFFLATFAWSALESFNLYLKLVKVVGSNNPPSWYYYGFGYGVPLLFVGITVAATQGEGYGTEYYCWLDPAMGLIWAFAGPLVCILSINMVAYVMMMRVLWGANGESSSSVAMGRKNTFKGVKDTDQEKKKDRKSEQDQLKKKIYGSIGFCFILGITWITGFFYLTEGGAFMAIPFVLLNSLQGVFIFVLTVVRDPFVKRHLARKLGMKTKGRDPGSEYASSRYTSEMRSTIVAVQ